MNSPLLVMFQSVHLLLVEFLRKWAFILSITTGIKVLIRRLVSHFYFIVSQSANFKIKANLMTSLMFSHRQLAGCTIQFSLLHVLI